MKLPAVGVAATTLVTSAGNSIDTLWDSLIENRTGLRINDLSWCDTPCWIGSVDDVDDVTLLPDFQAWDCRNHRLAWMALQEEAFRQAIDNQIGRVGSARIGLVLGTSTSGIRSTELAYAKRKNQGAWPKGFNYRHSHSADALCRFVGKALGVEGPTVAVVTACASSAKVFLTAQRWIAAGLVDAVIVGGVDSLCSSTLQGFNSLQLLSDDVCRPFDVARKGISIGEAAGFALLTRAQSPLQFLGGGESSDAWNISTPHPEGRGAQDAICAALKMTELLPSDIRYVNAHGTATPLNDRAEAAALCAVFTDHGVPVSSTKGITGHTLGAAGIVEAIITMEALERQVLPPSAHLITPDPSINLALVAEPQTVELQYAMTNNFGFGGANCSLIFGCNY